MNITLVVAFNVLLNLSYSSKTFTSFTPRLNLASGFVPYNLSSDNLKRKYTLPLRKNKLNRESKKLTLKLTCVAYRD